MGRRGLQKKRTRYARCSTGKRRFRERREAFEVLASCKNRRDNGDVRRQEVRAYKCSKCRGWHVTHLP